MSGSSLSFPEEKGETPVTHVRTSINNASFDSGSTPHVHFGSGLRSYQPKFLSVRAATRQASEGSLKSRGIDCYNFPPLSMRRDRKIEGAASVLTFLVRSSQNFDEL